MGTRLKGMLNVSRIPKELLVNNKNGELCVWIDVNPLKNGEDQFGNTHNISIYNKDTKQKIYIANLKPQEFEQTGQAPQSDNDTERMFGNVDEAHEKKMKKGEEKTLPAGADSLPF